MAKQIWRGANLLNPVPVVMVSCGDGTRDNIITVAWAGTVCSDPALVSISVRKERFSHSIIESTGEFAINLVSAGLVRACDMCGVKSGRDVDKFELCGLTRQDAAVIKAPLIAESPVSLECRVDRVIELGSHDMFIAKVECCDVEESILDEKGKLELEKAGLVAYSHGSYYGLGELLGTFGYSVRKK